MSHVRLGAAVLAVALAGCGAQGAESAPPQASTAVTDATPEASAPATAVATAPPSPTPTAIVPLALEVPSPVDLVPTRTLAWPGVSTLVPTRAGLWTVDRAFSRVIRRDPVTGRVTAQIDPVGPVYGNAFAFGALWTTDYDGDLVHRYDLQTGDHEQLAVGPGPDAILATHDAIWVADHRGDSLERIDPATRAISSVQVRESTGRGGPGAMVEAGGLVWVAVPVPGLVVAVDPVTVSVRRSERLTMIPCGAAALAEVVWIDACGDTPSAIGSIEVPMGEPAVQPLADRVYIAGRIADRDWLLLDGRLVAVDRSTWQVMAARQLDVPILSVVLDGGDVWLVSEGRVDLVPAEAFRA